jgi:hypothetical protein
MRHSTHPKLHKRKAHASIQRRHNDHAEGFGSDKAVPWNMLERKVRPRNHAQRDIKRLPSQALDASRGSSCTAGRSKNICDVLRVRRADVPQPVPEPFPEGRLAIQSTNKVATRNKQNEVRRKDRRHPER